MKMHLGNKMQQDAAQLKDGRVLSDKRNREFYLELYVLRKSQTNRIIITYTR